MIKSFDYYKKEIELHLPEWNKNGLPVDMTLLVFAMMGLDYYIHTVRDSGEKAFIGHSAILAEIQKRMERENKLNFKERED